MGGDISSAESSNRLVDELPSLLLVIEPPVESMAMFLPVDFPTLLQLRGDLCCPTVFVAFFASMLLVTRASSSSPSLVHFVVIVKTLPPFLRHFTPVPRH